MKTKHNTFLRAIFLTVGALGTISSIHAADYTWGGATSTWTDTTATGWNGGPPVSGDSATINSGTVTTTGNDQQLGVALTIGANGVLNANHYMFLGSAGSLTMNSGTINVSTNNGFLYGWYDASLSLAVNANSGSSFINGSGGIRLQNHTTFSGDGNLTIGLGLHNTNGAGYDFAATNVVKEGIGTLTLAGANTYSGATTVNDGTLVVEGAGQLYSNLGWQDRTVTVNSGGTLQLDRWDGGGSLGQLGYNQANIVINGGTIRFTGNSNGTSEGTGFTIGASGATLESAAPAGQVWNINYDVRLPSFAIASNSGGLLTLSGAGNGLISKVLPGSGGVTKTGAGTWTLSGANTYTGTTTVSAGTLSLTSPFLDNESPVVIESGATLNLNFSGNDIIGSLQINGSGPLAPGVYDASHPTYGSSFTGAGKLVVVTGASGTWTSLADGDWEEPSNWASNTIATGFNQTATFNQATGVTVTLTGNQTIGNLAFDTSDYTLTGSSSLTLDSSGTPTISVGSGRTAFIEANIGGSLGMEKTGAGELFLTGVKTFTGGTTVSGGTLTLSGITNGYGLINGDLTVGSGATLSTSSDSTGLGWRAGYKPTSLTINGGTVTSTGGDHIADIPGGVNMTGGTLETDGTIQWISTDLTTFASSATATISGGLNLRGELGDTSMAVDVADGAAATDLLISSNISELFGKLGITKTGTGTMTLSGINTYTGNTTINEGTLVLADDAQLTFAVSNSSQNLVGGTGTATFRGDFAINTSAVTGTTGGIWLLVDRNSLTGESFESTFSVIGFTQQGDGVTWTMTDAKGDWSFSEGSGELTLVVSSDYEDWELANGVTGGETDDDDNDGLSNFDEYAFGLDPTGGSSVNPITVQLNKIAKTFSYQRRDNGLTDLTYSVWYSTDLATWTQDTGATEGTPVLTGEVETVEVTLSTIPGNPLPAKLFIQVRAQ